jgi:hypothetical protein
MAPERERARSSTRSGSAAPSRSRWRWARVGRWHAGPLALRARGPASGRLPRLELLRALGEGAGAAGRRGRLPARRARSRRAERPRRRRPRTRRPAVQAPRRSAAHPGARGSSSERPVDGAAALRRRGRRGARAGRDVARGPYAGAALPAAAGSGAIAGACTAANAYRTATPPASGEEPPPLDHGALRRRAIYGATEAARARRRLHADLWEPYLEAARVSLPALEACCRGSRDDAAGPRLRRALGGGGLRARGARSTRAGAFALDPSGPRRWRRRSAGAQAAGDRGPRRHRLPPLARNSRTAARGRETRDARGDASARRRDRAGATARPRACRPSPPPRAIRN